MLVISSIRDALVSGLGALGMTPAHWSEEHSADKLVLQFRQHHALVSVAIWSSGCCDIISMRAGSTEPLPEHHEFSSVNQAASQIVARLAVLIASPASAT